MTNTENLDDVLECLYKEESCNSTDCISIKKCTDPGMNKNCYAMTRNLIFSSLADNSSNMIQVEDLNDILIAGCWAGGEECDPPRKIYEKFEPTNLEDELVHPDDKSLHHEEAKLFFHSNKTSNHGFYVARELLEPGMENKCITYIDKDNHHMQGKSVFCCCVSSNCNRHIVQTHELNPLVSFASNNPFRSSSPHTPYHIDNNNNNNNNNHPNQNNKPMIGDKEITAIVLGALAVIVLLILIILIIFYKKKCFTRSKNINLPSIIYQRCSNTNLNSPNQNTCSDSMMFNKNDGVISNNRPTSLQQQQYSSQQQQQQHQQQQQAPPVFSNEPFIKFNYISQFKNKDDHLYDDTNLPLLHYSPNDPQLLKDFIYANNNAVQQQSNFLVKQTPARVNGGAKHGTSNEDTDFSDDQDYQDSESRPLRLRASDLVLVEKIALGQLSTVWKAHCTTADTPEYAVKIFATHQKNSWLNEKDIYNSLILSSNENILKFISTDTNRSRVADASTNDQQDQSASQLTSLSNEYWLMTEYHPLGSLHDYLKANLVSWPEMIKLSYCILDGLSYLHSDNIPNTNKTFSIAHRDLKSKNILVRRLNGQLSCCIGDFGLALALDSPSKLLNSEIRNKVGTRRYMSPELLEGAISFTKETFLRIDVYACALVLWELISRGDFYEETCDYKMPFEVEVGLNPTLESMKLVVVENSQRPIIKQDWLKHHQMLLISKTIEECWDIDLDARLSAECASARIKKTLDLIEKS